MKRSDVFNPSQEMWEKLDAWLQNPEPRLETLERWLQGNGLPAVGHTEEPFIWLLRALPEGRARHKTARALAARVSLLLANQPDLRRPGRRPEQLLYNLLELCAGLNYPDELAHPLYDMFHRRRLDGEWLNVPLRGALLHALIFNQIDDRMKEDWLRLCETGIHEFLPGTRFDGLDGVTMMPPGGGQANRGEPAIDEIGYVLKLLAGHEDPGLPSSEEFTRLIRRVTDTYPGYSEWGTELFNRALETAWPTWALTCVTRTFGLFNPAEDSVRVNVPGVWVECLHPAESAKLNATVSGDRMEMELPIDSIPFLQAVAKEFGWARYNNPFKTEFSQMKVETEVMQELELVVEHARQKGAIVAAREKRLQIAMSRCCQI